MICPKCAENNEKACTELYYKELRGPRTLATWDSGGELVRSPLIKELALVCEYGHEIPIKSINITVEI